MQLKNETIHLGSCTQMVNVPKQLFFALTFAKLNSFLPNITSFFISISTIVYWVRPKKKEKQRSQTKKACQALRNEWISFFFFSSHLCGFICTPFTTVWNWRSLHNCTMCTYSNSYCVCALLYTNLIYSCHILLFSHSLSLSMLVISPFHFRSISSLVSFINDIHLLRYETLAFVCSFYAQKMVTMNVIHFSLYLHSSFNAILTTFFSTSCYSPGRVRGEKKIINLPELSVWRTQNMFTQSENCIKWFKFLAISRANCRVEINFMDMGQNEWTSPKRERESAPSAFIVVRAMRVCTCVQCIVLGKAITKVLNHTLDVEEGRSAK